MAMDQEIRAKHTPTPWREWNVIREEGADEYPAPYAGDLRIVGRNNICVGIIFGGVAGLPECEGNAALIVKAVNNHQALVDALRAIDALAVAHTIGAIGRAQSIARAALAQAGE